jgi:hypothetical protein
MNGQASAKPSELLIDFVHPIAADHHIETGLGRLAIDGSLWEFA